MKQIGLFIFYLLIVWTLFPSEVEAAIKINDIDASSGNTHNSINIKYSGDLESRPEVLATDKFVQIVIKDAVVWPKIEKQVGLGDKDLDSTLLAYQFDKKTVRVRALIPYSLKSFKELVTVDVKDGLIKLSFPKKYYTGPNKKDVAKYDENYLEKLLQDKKENSAVVKKATKGKFSTISDRVKTKMSATKEDKIPEFSLSKYISKFVAFLALVLLLFYAMVALMKKGVLRRGKLGLLNKMDWVTVLSNTHIGPKRSLMVVKVHNKVFLLGSSENGVNLISELDNVPGIVKDGEKFLSGENFDINLDKASDLDKEFKLKENLDQVNEVEDKVSFSQQIKNKVKELKPLQ